jgi:MFS family permease
MHRVTNVYDPRVGRHTVKAVRESQCARSGEPHASRSVILIAVLSAAGISVSLMQTLVIPMIPELPALLHTSASNASWAITVTLLTAAVATPVCGRLGDMYGPKPILIICAALLTAGSVTAALTSSLIPLIVGRGLQGFGLPVIPLGISVLRASVREERVRTAMGLMSASLGVGGALGLPLSALIAERYEWHTLFWFAACLGGASLLLFATLVPRIPAGSTDRFDPLGAIGLAAGLVTLLLPISKGASWGWTSSTTLGLLGASTVVFVLFGLWQFRVSSPIVDLRTTLRRPVLTTNLASIAIGFALLAMSLIGPMILELPTETGYGLGQTMLRAGLWMAPSGLAMMAAAPIAAAIAGKRGPKLTLFIGSVIVACGYLAGDRLLNSPVQILAFSVAVSVGVGFAFASLPALINAAVPASETAAANGINALARSLGTSMSSAVIGTVMAGMTTSFLGRELPSLHAFQTALLIAAGAAALAAALSVLIPDPAASLPGSTEPAPAAQPVEPQDWARREETEEYLRQLEFALTMLGRHSAFPPYSDTIPEHRAQWLDRTAYLLMSRIEDIGAMSASELALTFRLDASTVNRQTAAMVRNELLTRTDDPGRPRMFHLTPYGRERLYRHRAQRIDGLRRVLETWDGHDIAAVTGYLGRLLANIDEIRESANAAPRARSTITN